MLAGHAKENCTVAKSKKSLDFRQLGLDDLHQHIVPFKMTMSELTVNAYPLFKPGSREVVIAETTYTANKKMFLDDHETTRTCSRCSKEFRVNPNGTMISQKDACRYHNRATVCDGKKRKFKDFGILLHGKSFKKRTANDTTVAMKRSTRVQPRWDANSETFTSLISCSKESWGDLLLRQNHPRQLTLDLKL